MRSVAGCFPFIVAVRLGDECESRAIAIAPFIPLKTLSGLLCQIAAQRLVSQLIYSDRPASRLVNILCSLDHSVTIPFYQ
jgi:hypothetical protein